MALDHKDLFLFLTPDLCKAVRALPHIAPQESNLIEVLPSSLLHHLEHTIFLSSQQRREPGYSHKGLSLEVMCISITYILLARKSHMLLFNCRKTGKYMRIIGECIWLVLYLLVQACAHVLIHFFTHLKDKLKSYAWS